MRHPILDTPYSHTDALWSFLFIALPCSYFELEQAEYAKRGVNLSVEGWLVKLMVGGGKLGWVGWAGGGG